MERRADARLGFGDTQTIPAAGKDYATFVESRDVIVAMLEAESDSAVAVGWSIPVLRFERMGPYSGAQATAGDCDNPLLGTHDDDLNNGADSLTPEDVAFAEVTFRHGNGDAVIDGGASSVALGHEGRHLEQISFADGMVPNGLRTHVSDWNWGQEWIEGIGTDGDDIIDGADKIFMLKRGGGNDVLSDATHLAGEGGDDTYLHR